MKSIKKIASQARTHWQNLVDNSHRHMARGAEYINKVITFAHKDQWRRNKNKKK